jgi:hypothetical protein
MCHSCCCSPTWGCETVAIYVISEHQTFRSSQQSYWILLSKTALKIENIIICQVSITDTSLLTASYLIPLQTDKCKMPYSSRGKFIKNSWLLISWSFRRLRQIEWKKSHCKMVRWTADTWYGGWCRTAMQLGGSTDIQNSSILPWWAK